MDEVSHIAELSRIELSPTEGEEMRDHLKKMLGFFETLDAVDVSDVSPTAHILSAVNVLRDDTVCDSFDNSELLKNAPESDDGCYVVPRVVE